MGNGNAPGAFSCVKPMLTGYVCAMEGGTCSCTGKVKFGNFKTKDSAAKWSTEKAISGTTPCDTTTFGDPVTGTKGCWCTPTAATAKEDVKAADCTGGAAPTCVIMTATLSYTGLNYTDGLAVGANELTYRHIAAGGASQFSGKAGSKALTWSEKTLSMDIQIECANANDCEGKLTHATYTKTSEGYSIGMNKALKTWQAVAANKKEIGKLADYNPNWAFSIEKGNGVLAGAAATKKWTCGIPTTTTTVTTTTTTTKTVKEQTTPKPGNTDTGAVGGTTMPPAPDTGKVASNARSSTLSLISTSLLLLALVKKVIE